MRLVVKRRRDPFGKDSNKDSGESRIKMLEITVRVPDTRISTVIFISRKQVINGFVYNSN